MFCLRVLSLQDDEPAEPATKAKKEKKIKDPNAPKRPPSAYIEFQNNVRAKFREADPELSYAEVLRKIAAVWGTMSDDEKKVSRVDFVFDSRDDARRRSAFVHCLAPYAPVAPQYIH